MVAGVPPRVDPPSPQSNGVRSAEEDAALRLAATDGATAARMIANTPPLAHVKRPRTPRAPWSTEEDVALRLAVPRCRWRWNAVAVDMARFGRTATQCRAHWLHDSTRGYDWSDEEDTALVMLRVAFKCEWVAIRLTMPWRSGQSLKNRFAVHCRTAWGGAWSESTEARHASLPSPEIERHRLAEVAACLAMCAPLDWELA